MSTESFYNLNEYRRYPFKFSPVSPPLANAVIVDFECDIHPPAVFVPGNVQGNVYLESVDAVSNPAVVRFTFRQSNEVVADPIAVDVPKTSPEFCPFYAQGVTWRLFVVIGKIASVPSGFNATVNMYVEPARIRARTGNGITSFNFANNDRVTATLPTECDPSPTPPREVHAQAAGITNLTLQAGYNGSVSIGADNKTLTVGGLVGGGLGEPCGELPTYASEVPPNPDGPLTGGPWCNQTIKSVLGIVGPIIQFVPGTGITILPDSLDPNALRIAADLRNLLGPDRYLTTSSL